MQSRQKFPRFVLACLAAAPLAACLRPLERPASSVETVGPAPVSFDQHAGSRFGPGDIFEVRLVGEADLSGTYRVAPDGTFDFPYCGRMTASGLIASEVASKLVSCLRDGKFMKDPQVVVLGKDVGGNRKIMVLGYVNKAGPFPYVDNMSIIEAIADAGGFSNFAGQNQTSVIRPMPDGRDQRFKVPVQDIGLGRVQNFLLRPGDIVYVPESAF